MPKVEIDTPGVTIRMEADEISVNDLAKLALNTYRDAGGWPQHTPSAVGFTAELRMPPDTTWIDQAYAEKGQQ